MKLKRKKKRKSDLAVDFVTAYTVDECRDYLTRKNLMGSSYAHQAYVGESGRFKVEWGPLHGPWSRRRFGGIVLQFVGYLDPIEGGTRVHGAVTEGTRNIVKSTRPIAIIAVIVTILFVVFGLLANEIGSGLIVLIIGGLGCVGLIAHSYGLYREMHRLANWVQDQLYVLPAETSATEQDI